MPSGGAPRPNRSDRDTRSSVNPPEDEIRALGDRPTRHDRGEPSGGAAGDHDLDVLGRAKLRDSRGLAIRIAILPEHVRGQALATVPPGDELANRPLQSLVEPAAHARLPPRRVPGG